MSVKQIGPIELKERMTEQELILLDVREPQEVAYCHIEGSVHLPLREIKDAEGRFEKETPIVIYCHHGPRSTMACQVLIAMGFENVTNLDGGIDSWSLLVDSNVPCY